MDIWYSAWKFGIFFRFGNLYEEKSGNPGSVSAQASRRNDAKKR
jgi:hypothetical protein